MQPREAMTEGGRLACSDTKTSDALDSSPRRSGTRFASSMQSDGHGWRSVFLLIVNFLHHIDLSYSGGSKLQPHFQQNPWCSLASKIHIRTCRLQQVDAAQLLRLFCGNLQTWKLCNVRNSFGYVQLLCKDWLYLWMELQQGRFVKRLPGCTWRWSYCNSSEHWMKVSDRSTHRPLEIHKKNGLSVNYSRRWIEPKGFLIDIVDLRISIFLRAMDNKRRIRKFIMHGS